MQLTPTNVFSFAGPPEGKLSVAGGQAVIDAVSGSIYARPANAQLGSDGYLVISTPGAGGGPIAAGGDLSGTYPNPVLKAGVDIYAGTLYVGGNVQFDGGAGAGLASFNGTGVTIGDGGGVGTTTLRGNIIDLSANYTIVGQSGSNVGFFGASGGGQPTITGSTGGNAALAALLAGLDSLGLIFNDTTA